MKQTKLFNLLFPIWLLGLFPLMWLIIIPGNFIIDSLVLIVCLFILKINSKKEFYKKNILKIYLFGMLSDFIGAGLIALLFFGFRIGIRGDELYLTIPSVIITGLLIYIFNYKISFKNCEPKIRKRLSLIFAIVTAPYTFMIPISWIY